MGLFGKYGAANIGNDASFEAVLNYLREQHPEVHIDAMCTGPEMVKARYGIEAVGLQWSLGGKDRGEPSPMRKLLGVFVDAPRIAVWTRRHDAVVIPGTGVLEASLPLMPRIFPYSMLFLCIAGRLFGTKVALVDVGAGPVHQRTTRWIYDRVVRLASYRSYRDAQSRDELLRRGNDVGEDHIFPDLAFALATPICGPGDPGMVGIGVMDYHGSNDDRARAEEISRSYAAEMKRFVGWLLDQGRSVRFFVGDANGSDDRIIREIVADIQAGRPDCDLSSSTTGAVESFEDLMHVMCDVGSVVAIRYHGVLGALKLSKPTLSISYSAKHDALMADMGLPEFCVPAATLEATELVRKFVELEARSADVRLTLSDENAVRARLASRQLAELSGELFPSWTPDAESLADVDDAVGLGAGGQHG